MYRQRFGEILKKIIQQKFVSVNFFLLIIHSRPTLNANV